MKNSLDEDSNILSKKIRKKWKQEQYCIDRDVNDKNQWNNKNKTRILFNNPCLNFNYSLVSIKHLSRLVPSLNICRHGQQLHKQIINCSSLAFFFFFFPIRNRKRYVKISDSNCAFTSIVSSVNFCSHTLCLCY